MMTDKEDIHRRVDRLLAGIKRFQSRHQGDSENTIINRPVKPFEIKDFENYPYDYQYFMLTIGELYVGTAGYLALCINKPVVAGDINPLYTEVSEVVSLLDGEFEFSALQKDLLLFLFLLLFPWKYKNRTTPVQGNRQPLILPAAPLFQ